MEACLSRLISCSNCCTWSMPVCVIGSSLSERRQARGRETDEDSNHHTGGSPFRGQTKRKSGNRPVCSDACTRFHMAS